MEPVSPARPKVGRKQVPNGVLMKQTCQKRLARFLRDFSQENDSLQIAVLSLSALINSLGPLDRPGQAAHSTVKELIALIRETRPDSLPLAHLLNFMEREMDEILTPGLAPSAVRAMVVEKIKARIGQAKRCAHALSEQGRRYVDHDDRILVFGAGDSLIRSLVLARVENQRVFRVIGPRVFPDQPRRLAGELKGAGISFESVAPESLDDYPEPVNKVFLGPMPVTPGGKILAPKGSARILARCRQKGIPVYFFADTLHYGAAGGEPPKIREAQPAGDIIDLDRIDHIVTEIGEVNRAGVLLSVRRGPGRKESKIQRPPDSGRAHCPPAVISA